MSIHLLGTGGYHPSDTRETACVMLPEEGVILDAGTSFYRVAPLLRTETLDLFLTHAHLDHIVGLTYFLVPMLSGQVGEVRVHADAKTLAAVRTHLYAEPIFPVEPTYDFRLFEGDVTTRSGVRVRSIQQTHPGGSLGFRLDSDAGSVAYLTDVAQNDTNKLQEAAQFASGVDLVIHEANFADGREEWAAKTGHSTPSQAAELAARAGAGRLLLTHIDPQLQGDVPFPLDQSQAIFPETDVASDGQVVTL